MSENEVAGGPDTNPACAASGPATTPEDNERTASRERRRQNMKALTASEAADARSYIETEASRFDAENPNLPPPRIYDLVTVRQIKRQPWLIEHILPACSLGLLYGKEGTGKSFTALDIAGSVALGIDFLGHPTRQGPVVYLTAEGANGLGARVGGWLRDKGLAGQNIDDGPLFIVPEVLQLHTKYGQGRLMQILRDILPDIPTLVIIDPLQSYTSGADENSIKDIGPYISFINDIRHKFGCTVLTIHHSKKNVTPGQSNSARGHSSLPCAADTIVLVDGKNNRFELECEKQKDADKFDDIPCQLAVVPLDNDDSTCVLKPDSSGASIGEPTPKSGRGRPKSRERVLQVLWQAGRPLSHGEWLTTAKAARVSKSSFSRALRELLVEGAVTCDADGKYKPALRLTGNESERSIGNEAG
ncbi:MAG TPA: AAA family ATPase [Phycisphaerae bacterium]|nr:AAA family ATPase [Phycisphaerae bacterium]